ncbi:MAG: hypothetical protein HY905_28120 [Deltaproteobacteria bacterium]|nr:hypothetical protein [Deltaproteobacteria bacterium]
MSEPTGAVDIPMRFSSRAPIGLDGRKGGPADWIVLFACFTGGCWMSHPGWIEPDGDARDAVHDGGADADADVDSGADADSDADAETDSDGDSDAADDAAAEDVGPPLPCDSLAADLVVPDDFLTIQEAIDAAVDGQLICVEPGLYVGRIDFLGKRIHVVGFAGPDVTTIEPDGAGAVVRFVTGETAETIFEGFTVRGGHPSFLGLDGGGILVGSASPTLRNLTIRENRSRNSGGGVALGNSSATLVGLEISNNESTGAGGGLSAGAGGSPTLTDVRVVGNESFGDGGGGLYFDRDTSPTLIRVRVIGNESFGDGGGMEASAAVCRLTNVVIAGNRARNEGGGIKLDEAASYLDHVRIVDNQSNHAGGIAITDSGWNEVRLTNVVIAGNHAEGASGGMNVNNSEVVLENVVIVGNACSGRSGGGIRNHENLALTMTNVVVAGNRSDLGGAVASERSYDPVISNCAFWDNGFGPFDGLADPTGHDGNISVDPLFLDLSGTDPLLWDLHLQVASPLIHAGSAGLSDPDGAPSSIGAYGGLGGGAWDLDGDAAAEWWQAGAYDPGAYPAAGWDCDDRDPAVHPGSGC